MGSQWTGMGTSLMKLPIFNESISKSHNILKEFRIDLVKIITSTDPNILNNIVNSFVGIAAMQVNILFLCILKMFEFKFRCISCIIVFLFIFRLHYLMC